MQKTEIEALDWRAWLRPGDRIACSHMSAEPAALLRSLAERLPYPEPFDIFLGAPFGDAAAAMPPQVRLTTLGGMGTAGAMGRKRRLRISNAPYSRGGRLFSEGIESCDVALVSLARAPDGRLMLGASHGFIIEAARRARCVVAEVNARAPAIAGATWPDDLPIHAMTEVDEPLPASPDGRIAPADAHIAQRIAGLVEDGACLQVGIGALASAVLGDLRQHRGLGVHSGMWSPAMRALVECGAIDNSRKPIDTGVSVIGCAYGDAALYAAADGDPALCLRPPDYTHEASVLARLDHLAAINSALEVDLLGQANAEAVLAADGSWRQVGAVGGLNDFVRGARQARGGKAVVALHARAGNGTPRIV
ncbi:MAG: 4-hydroxybutyrate CoA-transferase, partial [Gammaproteobacteria bacterium]|nr:4-hydroxybutyrate CoA-transferase [Gammaproteobacteria bacterium]